MPDNPHLSESNEPADIRISVEDIKDMKHLLSFFNRTVNSLVSRGYSIHVAEDATSTAICHLVAAQTRFDGFDKMQGWVWVTSKNKAIDVVKRDKTDSSHPERVLNQYPCPNKSIEDQIIEADNQVEIQGLFSAYKKVCKEVFDDEKIEILETYFGYREGMSRAELAKALNVNSDCLRQIVSRMVRRLRKELSLLMDHPLSCD